MKSVVPDGWVEQLIFSVQCRDITSRDHPTTIQYNCLPLWKRKVPEWKPNQNHHNPSSPCTRRFHLPQTSLIWGLFHLWGSTRETSRKSVSIFSGLWSHTPRRHANQNVILATVAEPMKSWVRKIALAPRDFVYLEHYLSGAYFIFGGPQVMLVDGLYRFTAP